VAWKLYISPIIVRYQPGSWAVIALVLLAVLSTPAPAQVDLICPGCEAASVLRLSEVLDLVFGTLLRQGIALLIVGSAAVVALPWAIAAAAVAIIYVPRWLKPAP